MPKGGTRGRDHGCTGLCLTLLYAKACVVCSTCALDGRSLSAGVCVWTEPYSARGCRLTGVTCPTLHCTCSQQCMSRTAGTNCTNLTSSVCRVTVNGSGTTPHAHCCTSSQQRQCEPGLWIRNQSCDHIPMILCDVHAQNILTRTCNQPSAAAPALTSP